MCKNQDMFVYINFYSKTKLNSERTDSFHLDISIGTLVVLKKYW